MYLACRFCGALFCLAKYYPDTGFYSNCDIKEQELTHWLSDHDHRSEHVEFYDNEGDGMFTLITELDKRVKNFDLRNRKVVFYKRYQLK